MSTQVPTPAPSTFDGTLDEQFANFLRGDYAQAILRNLGYAKSTEVIGAFPKSANRGDRVEVRVGTDKVWGFIYDPDPDPDYPWSFKDGESLWDYIVTEEGTGTGSTSYQNLSTTGPLVTIPFAGYYSAHWGCYLQPQSGSGRSGFMGMEFGASVAGDSIAARGGGYAAGINVKMSHSRRHRPSAVEAGDDFTAKYRTDNTSVNCLFGQRWLYVTPLRVSGF